jgi:hypothetical protein
MSYWGDEDYYGYVPRIPAYVLCRVCGVRCLWRDEPGCGWRLYESGHPHTCRTAVTEMEDLDARRPTLSEMRKPQSGG